MEPINKISRPKLSKVFERKRLFELLYDVRHHSVISISAPAGAGKTTLVASYLESINLNCIWYQIDHRDNDPATFFYYLSLAVKRATPRKRKTIPMFNQQFMPGIDSFTLRFFETVYQRLPKPFVIVMDNYQQIKPEARIHGIISGGLSILPQGITGILISREQPPATFSRMLANRKMFKIGWDSVRLTLEESAGIARLQTGKSISKSIAQNLHKATDGWAAGLVLMLSQDYPEDFNWKSVQSFTPNEMLDYFAKEVFESEAPEVQDFLLRAAFLPYMTTLMAKKLTGYDSAAQFLAKLNRENRFMERRLRKRIYYQFHPLYREFLLSQANDRHSEKELNAWRSKAAKLLTEESDADSAAELLQDAKEWDALTELIVKHALTMIQQGRNQSLLQWLQAMPKELIVEKPWLEAWMGIALYPFDQDESRAYLEKAFGRFRKNNDTFGLFLCWSFIIRVIFIKMKDFSSLDHWMQVLEELMVEYQQVPSREIEGHVVAGALMVLGHRQMDHPDIESWVNRALVLLSSSLDLNTKVSIGNNAVHYFLLTGDYGKANQIIDLLRPSSFEEMPDSKDIIAVVAHATISSLYYCYIGMHAKCIDSVYRGLKIAKKAGFIILNNIMVGHGILSSLIHEEYATAKTLWEENSNSLKNAKPLDQGLVDYVKSLKNFKTGNLNQAKAYAASALKASVDVGSQFSTIFCHLLNARVLSKTGDQNAANDHLNKALNYSQSTRMKHLIYHSLMLKARFILDQEHSDDFLRVLRDALAIGKEIGLYHNMIDSRSNIARLFMIALEHNIETSYVSTYIRKRGLIPDHPPIAVENWPWPIKIFTLGKFVVLKHDQPIKFSGKAQKKPLAMLRVLIAAGGRNVSEEKIADILWPDADGDLAHRSFATTLHRLRKLIGTHDALSLSNNRLSLNPGFCWVDARAFEFLLEHAERECAKAETNDKGRALFKKALELYQGPFLDTELDAWNIETRERLKSKYLRTVERFGSHLESIGQAEKAIELYHRAADVEPLAENIYCRLMLVLKNCGQHSEAIAVYERCRTILENTLDVSPSKETESIYKSLVQ